MNYKVICMATIALTLETFRVSAQSINVVRTLPGYACMSLAKLWDGIGPMPPRVPVYEGPEPSAPQAGFAGPSIIVRSPIQVTGGRAPMLWPNGRTVWISAHDFVPWHVASDPHATCKPALLSNGIYGFSTTP